MNQNQEQRLNLAAKIVSAHVGSHETTTAALPSLIREIYRTLAAIEPELAAMAHAANPSRLRSIAARQSANHSRPTCRDRGLSMKMLKRHPITIHGQTPDEYRTKWGPPSDEPMVTSEYAKLRSSLAKQSTLGKRPDAARQPREDDSSKG